MWKNCIGCRKHQKEVTWKNCITVLVLARIGMAEVHKYERLRDTTRHNMRGCVIKKIDVADRKKENKRKIVKLKKDKKML